MASTIEDPLNALLGTFQSLAQNLLTVQGAIQGLAASTANAGVASQSAAQGFLGIAETVQSFGSGLAASLQAVAGFVASLSVVAAKVSAALLDPFLKLTSLIVAPVVGAVTAVVGSLASFVVGLLTSTVSAILESTVVQSVVIPALVALATTLGILLVPLLAVVAAFAAVAALIGAVVVAAFLALAAAVAAATAIIVGPFVAAATLLTAAVTGLTAPLAAIGAAAAAAVGPFLAVGAAASAITAPFQMLGNALGPFVSALNPSAMEAFNYALKTLQATIGVALVPVIQVFTTAMRNVAGAIVPLMRDMAPILKQLASQLAGLLLPVVQLIVESFKALMPFIQLAVDLLGPLVDAFKILAVVLRTFVQSLVTYLTSLFGGTDLKEVAAKFRDVLQQMVLAIVRFVALIAKSLGQLDFLKNLIANLNEAKKPAEPGVAPAATDVAIKSIESITKDLAVASFAAQGGTTEPQETELDFLKQLADAVKGIQENGETLQDWINKLQEFLDKKFNEYWGSLKREIEDSVYAAWNRIKSATQTAVNHEVDLARAVASNPSGFAQNLWDVLQGK